MVILVIWMLFNIMYSVRKSAQFYTNTLSYIACILGSRLYILTCIVSICIYPGDIFYIGCFLLNFFFLLCHIIYRCKINEM